MAFKAERRTQLATMQLPTDREIISRTRAFLIRSGLVPGELADQVGYAPSSLSVFLGGHYGRNSPSESNTRNIRAALKEYLDLNEIKQDIRARGRHFETNDCRRLRDAAHHALADGVAYLVDGAPGTQKSWALLQVAAAINDGGKGRAIYVYTRAGIKPQSFLQECCTAAGIPSRGTIDQLLRKLRFFLADKPTVLMVDEGNHLDHVTLEVLRQLLDLPPYFGVIIAGSHELAMRLSHWQMEQWRRRTRETLIFDGPSKEEARVLLAERLGITDRDEANAIVADCMATLVRSGPKDNRDLKTKHEYVSAGLLFDVVNSLATEMKAEAICA